MLAIFTIPKAFEGHTGVIQYNALHSWMRLGPGCEVFVCGDDPGVGEAAHEAGASWIPSIQRNDYGTPVLRSAFDAVVERSEANVFCYVNADIIFFTDLIEAVQRLVWRKTVVAGQRWDLDVDERIDFDSPEAEQRLHDDARSRGRLHGAYGSDYFIFPRDPALLDIPPFGVGRPGWDCWYIYHVRKLGYRMVDATSTITAIHQNHDYSHLPTKSGSTRDGKKWLGPEVDANQRLIRNNYFTLDDATHVLGTSGVRLALDYEHLRNRWYRVPELHPRCRHIARLADVVMPRSVRTVLRRMLG